MFLGEEMLTYFSPMGLRYKKANVTQYVLSLVTIGIDLGFTNKFLQPRNGRHRPATHPIRQEEPSEPALYSARCSH